MCTRRKCDANKSSPVKDRSDRGWGAVLLESLAALLPLRGIKQSVTRACHNRPDNTNMERVRRSSWSKIQSWNRNIIAPLLALALTKALITSRLTSISMSAFHIINTLLISGNLCCLIYFSSYTLMLLNLSHSLWIMLLVKANSNSNLRLHEKASRSCCSESVKAQCRRWRCCNRTRKCRGSYQNFDIFLCFLWQCWYLSGRLNI